jgi:putative nucleotidyltransferase with HDIG domain
MSQLWSAIPSINLINDDDLREKTMACFEATLARSVFSVADLLELPFTLLIPNCPVSFTIHTESVAAGAYHLALYLMKLNERFKYDLDVLVSGGILHDVGKLLEYEKQDGKIIQGTFGKYLRHPISGAALALEFKLPPSVAHIIAAHSKEGDGSPRTIEANLIHHLDFINFETYKTIFGVK